MEDRAFEDRHENYDGYKNYGSHGSENNNGPGRNSGHGAKAAETGVDKTGLTSAKLTAYLSEALQNGDTNHNGTLSHKEFERFRQGDKNPAHIEAAQFVEKHFGTLSILSTDSMFSEGGISQKDVSALDGPVRQQAEASYKAAYESPVADTGAVIGGLIGLGAQTADFAYTGGAVTSFALMGSFGLAGLTTVMSDNRIPPMALLSEITASMMWGPLGGGVVGYMGGEYLSNKVAGNKFERKYAPQIDTMLKELKN